MFGLSNVDLLQKTYVLLSICILCCKLHNMLYCNYDLTVLVNRLVTISNQRAFTYSSLTC